MQKLLLGLNQLHNAGIVHKDIKPNNILIEEKTAVPHYIDYGFSCTEQDIKCLNERVGTPLYLSPECFAKYPLSFEMNKKIDIWALGITFIGICFGSSLWKESDKDMLYLKIETATDYDVEEELNNGIQNFIEESNVDNAQEQAEIFKSIILPMLKVKPNERISTLNALKIISKIENKVLLMAKSNKLIIPKSSRREMINLLNSEKSTKLPARKIIDKVSSLSMQNIKSSKPLYGLD